MDHALALSDRLSDRDRMMWNTSLVPVESRDVPVHLELANGGDHISQCQ
jgi:hypothetical protein